MEKEIQPLFKGMTRPAMLFGVPLSALILVLGIFLFVALWSNPLYFLFAIPVVLIMRFIASYDDFMYAILGQGLKCITPGANKKYYGAKTYTALPLKNISNKVDIPTLSILGLNSNPSFTKFIPFSSFKGNSDDGIILTKEFEFISTWEIKGIAFEVENNQRQDYINRSLANVFTSFCNDNVAFYFHASRHDVDTKLKAKYNNKYLQDINDLYYKSFTSGSSKQTNLYLTMIYNPFLNKLEKRQFKRLNDDKYKNELLNLIDKFKDYCNKLESNLSKFQAKKLIIYKEQNKLFSNQLEFYNYLIGGRFLKTRALNAPINEYLTGGLKNIQFAQDLIQLNYNDATKKFAQAIEIKDYTSETFCGILDALMYLDVNYTITQSFTPMSKIKAKDLIKKQQKHFKSSCDDSITQEIQFHIALDRLTNGEICFGDYHFSLVVFAQSIKQTKENSNKVITYLQDIGLQVSLADIHLPHVYFSQIPSNYALRARVSPIMNENFASLIALHNFPKGREKNNPWGDAVTVLKTPSKQPYYFNLHAQKSKNDFGDFTLANFLVLGQSGGGKTAFLQFLNNQLLKFASKDTFPVNIQDNLRKMTLVYLDKDYGAMGNILSSGGRYISIQNGVPTGFNPFMVTATQENIRKLQILMKVIVTLNGETLKTSEEKELALAIENIMKNNIEDRTYGISLLLENLTDDNSDENSLKQRLSLWKKGAKYGWVFDNEKDLLDFPDDISIFGIDGTEFLNDPDVNAPISSYILWRVLDLLDGRRFALQIDEFWQWLANDLVANETFNKLKTIRKENGLIGLASQSVEDVLKLSIARAIVEQTSTHIFFPNEKANEQDYVQGLGCSYEEYLTIKNFDPSQYPFMVKRSGETAIVNLDLSTLGKENISIISTGAVHIEKVKEIFQQENKTLEQKVDELKSYYKNI